jgi:general secretion pathway protein D
MVFLRPVVLRDVAGMESITSEQYRQTIEEQKKTEPAPHPVLPDIGTPVLPPLPHDQ